VLVVETPDGGLGLRKASENFAATERIGIGSRCWSDGVGRALLLDTVKVRVEGADFRAEFILVGDAGFEAGDIESDDVGTRSGERGGKRAEKRETAFEKIEVACVVSTHGQARSSNWCFSSFSSKSMSGADGGALAGAGLLTR